MKYTQAGGHVDVTAARRRGRRGAAVEVSDDGPGIGRRAPAARSSSASTASTRPAQPRDLGGTGPGLSIVEAPGREHRRHRLGREPARPGAHVHGRAAPPRAGRVRPGDRASGLSLCGSQRHRSARAEVLRDHLGSASGLSRPEHAVAHARHEIAERVEERSGGARARRRRAPATASRAGRGCGSRRCCASAAVRRASRHEAVGECRCARASGAALPDASLSSGAKRKGAAVAVAREHEAHGPVAERAGAVVEEPLGRRERPASRLPARHIAPYLPPKL